MTLWRIRTTIDDRPGYLSVLTASLALRGINILAVQVHTTEAGAVDDFLIDAPDDLTEADLATAVERGRGRQLWLARSAAKGLVDQPTRALGLATRLVYEPEALGEMLRRLLDADTVTWRPVAGAGGPGGGVLRLPDGAGGSYEVIRQVPAFTPAEYARAQSLVELAAAAQARAEYVNLALPDGTELVVRPACAEDLTAVQALHERCSARTRQRRYLSGAALPSVERMCRLLTPTSGSTLIALDPVRAGSTASVVAMANLIGEGDEAEAALLVRDDWQRRGLGTALLRRLLTHADRSGCLALVLHIQVENVPMLRTLRRLDRPVRVERDGAMLTALITGSAAAAGRR